jgi:hypothetical protein
VLIKGPFECLYQQEADFPLASLINKNTD